MGCEKRCEKKCDNECVKGNLHVHKNLSVRGKSKFCKEANFKGGVVIKDLMAPRNVFIIGPSSSETGNLTAYYPSRVAEFTQVNSKIRKWINLFNGDEVALGPLNRHSEGLAMPDFITKKIGYKLVNSNEITKTPNKDCFVLNYAVSGATAVGNNWNVPNGAPNTWEATTGANGYNSQVSLLLSQLSASGKSASENDVVIYNGVGGNDVPAIALTNAIFGPVAAAAAIGEFLTTHIANIQALYDAGFRHIYLDYIGAATLDYIPSAIKTDVAVPGTLAALKGLTDTLFLGPTGLLELLSNQAAATMSELHLSYSDDSFAIDTIALQFPQYGLRERMVTDPDPRGSPAKIPFPTMLNILAINSNRNDYNVGFIDDFHLQQITQERYGEFISRFFLPWVVN